MFGGVDPSVSKSEASSPSVDPTVSSASPTKCQARTRLYRNGAVLLEGFPVSEVSDHLEDPEAMIWLDLFDPDEDDLVVLSDEFGLHQLAIEDAVQERQRPKLDRYPTHLFLNAYGVCFDSVTGELATSEIAAFVMPNALITVRKDAVLDVGSIVDRWDQNPDLAVHGVGFLLQGLLDVVVDTYFLTVQFLDDELDVLEDQLFAESPAGQEVQRRSFELRKSLVRFRRVVLPMREVVNTLLRRDLKILNTDLGPYYQDIYDHVLRATEWTESLRDMVTTIMDTNLTIQGNRMNVISKKVTSWAAIIAVPTFITGFAGMNLPYPGFSQRWGVAVAVALMVFLSIILYVTFRRKEWL